MKKIILTVLAVTMILSNVAMVSAKTIHSNATKDSIVSSANQINVYHVDSTDPY